MSEQAIRDKVESAIEIVDEQIDTCPIAPLGHRHGTYYFLSPVGEMRTMRPSDFTVNGLGSLFEGDDEWLGQWFPRYDKKGNQIGFSANNAAAYLMRACRDEGLFDHSIPIRGLGVWRSTDRDAQGRPILIVHSGKSLHVGGERTHAGQRIGDAIYPAAPSIQSISDDIASAEDGERLQDAIAHWTFRREIDRDLFLGFLGQAQLGGAPPWRAHMMVNGKHGSGKSYLATLAASVLGGAAHPMTNNYSEAGLRQAMTEQARCLILDEAEAEEGGGRINAVIELLRHMSGGDGVRALRGSSGGHAQGFSVTGCALMLSVLRVPLKPQDRSRITQIQIVPPEQADPGIVQKIQSDIDFLKTRSPLFRARMVQHWPVFLQNFETYRRAFVEGALSSRAADQLATLLAGRDTLLYDNPVAIADCEGDVERFRILFDDDKVAAEDGEGQQCWTHLLTSMTDAHRSGDRMTVAQLIMDAIEVKSPDENKKLGQYGIRMEFDGPPRAPSALIIANQHQGLDRIFAGTRWAGGGWRGALEYLGGSATEKPQRFAGALSRGWIIPQEHWPEKGD